MVEKMLFGLLVFTAILSGAIFWCHNQMLSDYDRLEKELHEYHERDKARKPDQPKEGLALAFLNKNPLNVKAVEGGWEGQVGVDGQGHAIFKTWEHGMRAASIVLKNYAKRHKIDTISDVIDRFAEGNRKEYKKFVAKRLRVKIDEKIDLISKMPELLRAMARFESGTDLPDILFIPYDIRAGL